MLSIRLHLIAFHVGPDLFQKVYEWEKCRSGNESKESLYVKKIANIIFVLDLLSNLNRAIYLMNVVALIKG